MNIALLQQAVKHIEADADKGLPAAADLVGMPTALAVLIAYQRISFGLTEISPAEFSIDAEVTNFLRGHVPAVQHYLAHDCALFYTGEWYCFDNFSAFAVEWNGRTWPTAEHAYQAAKFDQEHMIERVFQARSAHEAKKIANDPQYAALVRPDWQEVKHDIMEDILRAKFAQHEYVRKKLRESRGKLLVEDSHRDAHWGRGPDWNGENWLGRLWMRLRSEYFPN